MIAALVLLGAAVAAGLATPEPSAAQSGATTSTVSGPQPQVISNVAYGTTGDPNNVLYVYLPTQGGAPHPAIVLVHGGGWTGGDTSLVAPDAIAYAQAGFVAFNIQYDLTGQNLWPDQLEDTQDAIRWIQDNASTYSVDPARVGLYGSSAGGNLVMLVGTYGLGQPGQYDAPSTGRPPVKAVAAWSGPTDLTTIAPTNEPDSVLSTPSVVPIPGEDTPVGCEGDIGCIGLISPEYLQAYMGDCNVDECPDTYAAASPALQANASTPPMYLAGATEDLVPIEQNYEMVDALTLAGITSRLQVVQGEGHAESYRSVAMQPTIDFMNQFVTDGANPKIATTSPPTTVAGSAALPALTNGNLLPAPNLDTITARAALGQPGNAAGPDAGSSGAGGTTVTTLVPNAEQQLRVLDIGAIVLGLAVVGLGLFALSRRRARRGDA